MIVSAPTSTTSVSCTDSRITLADWSANLRFSWTMMFASCTTSAHPGNTFA